jgi:CBS domain-containing protein
MVTVKDILNIKGSEVFSIPPQTTIKETLKFMTQKNIGAVMVMEGEKVKGIFSERDYVRHIANDACNENATVASVMTHTVYYVGPLDTVDACMAQMTDKHIRHLPVVDGGIIVGLISIGDVVKATIADYKSLINSMENYIFDADARI